MYDTSGLSDPELLQYILEGQKEEVKEDSSSPKGNKSTLHTLYSWI